MIFFSEFLKTVVTIRFWKMIENHLKFYISYCGFISG